MYLNKAIIIGNLTRDPELKALPTGMSVTSFAVATNRVWKDKNNAKQESTDYHNVVVFGRQAETSAQYLNKGSSVLVEGRLQTRSWEADGKKLYRTEIIADSIQFGFSKPESEKPENREYNDEPSTEPTSVGHDGEVINPTDIPF